MRSPGGMHEARQEGFLQRIAPALGLFFLAPVTAEYLIGYLPVTGDLVQMLVDLWLFAPLYGGAALIIREAARRTARGWPAIILLSAAFGVFQAGLVDHSLFDPAYHGTADPTYLALGISGTTALAFILGHVVWSISAPIAIVETFVPRRRTVPWLGRAGLAVTGVLYALASAIIFRGTAEEDLFLPSMPQMIGTALVVAALIGLAFSIRSRSGPPVDLPVPGPWAVGAAAFAALSVPTFIELVLELLGASSAFMSGWPGVALNLVLVGALALLVRRWSHREGWSAAHTLALAGSALLARAWIAFLVVPFGDVALHDKLIGNTVLFVGVAVLLTAAALKIRMEGELHE
jgi:hypothetical protein